MKRFKKISLRSVISFIMGLLIMVILAAFSICSFMRYVVINPDKYLDVLHSNNTEKKIYDMIKENLDYALVQSNLPKDLVSDIISEEEVKEECDNQLENLITYLKSGENNVNSINTDKYINRFDEKLNIYIKDTKINVDDTLNKDVNELKASLGQIIKNGIEVVSSDIVKDSATIERAAAFTSKFNGSLYYLFYVVTAVLILAVMLLWHKDISEGLRWVSSSFIGSGILLTLIFSAGLISKFYDNVIIYTPYLKEFVSNVVKNDVIWLLVSGIIILAIGIVLYIVSSILAKRKNKLEV